MSQFYDNASLVVVPSGYKAGTVYAQKPLTTDGQLSFTRASNATRVASNGLIEKVRTNLATYSEDFANAAWGKTDITVTANTTANPVDGATTADTLTRTGAVVGFINRQIAQTGIVTFSVFAKAGSTDLVRLNTYDGAADRGATYNLTTGAITGAYGSPLFTTAQSFGNGWYRISVSVNSATYTRCQIHLDTINSVIVFGAMLETNDIATAYIPTTSAAVSVGPVSNVPRLDYLNSSCPRLLLEPQRTNLATNSEIWNGTGWIAESASVTANAATSPSGYQDADLLTGTGSFSRLRQSGFTLADNTIYTVSSFLKAGTAYSVRLTFVGKDGVDTGYTFNLQNGTAESGAKIENYGNGWYRCSFTANSGSGATTVTVRFASNNAGVTGGWTNGLTIYAWGAQLEAGAYATSYIPTLSASVTRVVDAMSKANYEFGITTEATLFADYAYQNTGSGYSTQFLIYNSGLGNYIYLYVLSNSIRATCVSGGVIQSNITLAGATAGTRYKVAARFKTNDFALYVNGTLVGTDTSGTMPNLSSGTTDSYLGNDGSNSEPSGYINQLIAFPTALTNAQLAELTTL